MKVFLADDSSIVRNEIVIMLSEMDTTPVEIVGEAEDATAAITGIIASNPDLAILDIQMPNGSGIDVLQTIKRQIPKVACIMLTNFPTIEYKTKCMSLGADYFLDKHTEVEKIPGLINLLNEKLFPEKKKQ